MNTYISRFLSDAISNRLLEALEILVNESLVFEYHVGRGGSKEGERAELQERISNDFAVT